MLRNDFLCIYTVWRLLSFPKLIHFSNLRNFLHDCFLKQTYFPNLGNFFSVSFFLSFPTETIKYQVSRLLRYFICSTGHRWSLNSFNLFLPVFYSLDNFYWSYLHGHWPFLLLCPFGYRAYPVSFLFHILCISTPEFPAFPFSPWDSLSVFSLH